MPKTVTVKKLFIAVFLVLCALPSSRTDNTTNPSNSRGQSITEKFVSLEQKAASILSNCSRFFSNTSALCSKKILILEKCCLKLAFEHPISSGIVGVRRYPIAETSSYWSSILVDLGHGVQKLLSRLPENIKNHEEDLEKIKIELHTRNATVKYELSQAIQILSDPGFDKSLPITIIVHGFLCLPESKFSQTMTDTFEKRGGINVLFLDASSAIFVIYTQAVTRVKYVGELLAEQLAAFVAAGIKPTDIHCVGHSLGAHICGFTGKAFQHLTKKKIRRISGLDPAGPCFFNCSSDLTLAKTDAEFVDVIHTDAGVFGILKPLGTVDFYPNGGAAQPNSLVPPSAHSRSWELYEESILHPRNFMAVKCTDWETFLDGRCNNNEQAYMGYEATPGIQGKFYLKTSGSSHYGLGQNGIETSEGSDTSLPSTSLTSKLINRIKRAFR